MQDNYGLLIIPMHLGRRIIWSHYVYSKECQFVWDNYDLIVHFAQLQPKKIELVHGYGVFLTQRQLDEAVQQTAQLS